MIYPVPLRNRDTCHSFEMSTESRIGDHSVKFPVNDGVLPENAEASYSTSVLVIASPSFTSMVSPFMSTLRAWSRRKPRVAVILQFSKVMP